MADATVSRLGQADLAGNTDALFLKVFAGEVLTAFETQTKLKGKTRQRSISSGKSAQFPAIHKVGASYHTPGTELTGQQVPHNEVIVTLDQLLVSDVFIADIDEAMNHYDVRSPYSTEMGRALALEYDKNIARNILLAARGGALFSSGDFGGSVLTNASYDTDGAALSAAMFDAKQALEEKDVPVDTTDVHAFLKPAQWYLLAQYDKVQNRDYGDTNAYHDGVFNSIAGVKVQRSNALPFGVDESIAANVNAKYRGNWLNTRGMVFTEGAAATLQLMDLSMQSQWDIRRQGTLMVGRYAVGHGPLLNKCAVELAIA